MLHPNIHMDKNENVWQHRSKEACLCTSGVSGVDDAQDSRLAVLLSRQVSTLQLLDVQRPAISLIQVVVDVHALELGNCCRVEWVLRDGDHHTCPGPALAGHQQLQDALETADNIRGLLHIHICIDIPEQWLATFF